MSSSGSNSPNGRDENRKFYLALSMAALAMLGVIYQHFNMRQMSKQVRVAENQAYSAHVQADAAVTAVKVTDVERFREHMRRVSKSLDINPNLNLANGPVITPSVESGEQTYEVLIPYIETREIGRNDESVREESILRIRHEWRTRIVEPQTGQDGNSQQALGGLATVVDAMSSYEAAVKLEEQIKGQITSMEYLLLAGFAYALDGVNAAEAYVKKAIDEIDSESTNYKHVLLYSTLGTLYYDNHPRLSSTKGAEYFERAKDLYRKLPEDDQSNLTSAQLWLTWAEQEYSIGNEGNGEKYEQEGWKELVNLGGAAEANHGLIEQFALNLEYARQRGGLSSKGQYSLGVTERSTDETEAPIISSDYGAPPPAPTVDEDES